MRSIKIIAYSSVLIALVVLEYLFWTFGMLTSNPVSIIPFLYTWDTVSRMVVLVCGGKSTFGMGAKELQLIKGDRMSYVAVGIGVFTHIPISIFTFYLTLDLN